MSVKIEKIENNRVKLTIEVEAGKIAVASDRVYAKLAPNVKVAGFRPGKAPKDIVIKEVGQEHFEAEILDDILPITYYEAITAENLKVVGAPEVKVLKFVLTDGLTYEAVVDVMPEIKLPDLAKIKVKRQATKVETKEVDEVLNDLAKQLSKYESVDRAAKKGDRVEIDFEGFLKGLPFDGGKSQNHPLVLGSGSFIPGFEEQLEGMKAGEEREIEVTFPKEYHAANLKGEKVTFKVKVHSIEEMILPEITDAFAKEVGEFENLAKLKEDIEKQLVFTKEQNERKRVEDEILDSIAKDAKFAVPKSLAHEEQHRMIHEAENNLMQQGATLDQYLEMTGKKRDDLESEMLPEAEKRVKIGMILTQVAKDIDAGATDKEIDEFIADRMNMYPEDQREAAKKYYEDHDGRHQVENAIMGKKVLDYLYENCSK
jgi:trigger factor